jgi:hypothetical protein
MACGWPPPGARGAQAEPAGSRDRRSLESRAKPAGVATWRLLVSQARGLLVSQAELAGESRSEIAGVAGKARWCRNLAVAGVAGQRPAGVASGACWGVAIGDRWSRGQSPLVSQPGVCWCRRPEACWCRKRSLLGSRDRRSLVSQAEPAGFQRHGGTAAREVHGGLGTGLPTCQRHGGTAARERPPYISAARRHSGTAARERHGRLGETSLPEAGKAKLLVTGAR